MNKDIKPQDFPITMIINEISKLFHDHMRNEAQKMGIPSGYRHLMFHLSRQDNITQQDLVLKTHLKPPTVSVTLQNMEQEGLVIRKAGEIDSRESRVCLTEKGRQLDNSIRQKVNETEKIILQSITLEDEKIIKPYLLKMRDNLLKESELK